MTDTEFSGSWLTSSLTTVVFPEPEPPAIPITNIILSFRWHKDKGFVELLTVELFYC